MLKYYKLRSYLDRFKKLMRLKINIRDIMVK